jgi:hypothetical protein
MGQSAAGLSAGKNEQELESAISPSLTGRPEGITSDTQLCMTQRDQNGGLASCVA